MKGLFIMLAMAAILTACNSSTEQTTTTSKDSVSTESPLTDAVNTADSASRIIADSTGKLPDSLNK